jgi:malonyl-CoA/methylmalonyl-CoA synthetase
MTELPVIESARQNADRTAIIAAEGAFTYQQLLDATEAAARRLLAARAERPLPDLGEGRVAFLVPPGFDHVVTQWAIWRAGGVAVPLALMHPPPELDYVIGDSGASIVVAHPSYEAVLRPLAEARGVRFVSTAELVEAPSQAQAPAQGALPAVELSRRALIVYTSGTTGRPKGVVTSHAIIEAQAQALLHAWQWTRDDRILHVLPLHHVHGILNVLFCALRAGALCELMPRFDAEAVWERFAAGELSLFMAVPTIYARLIQAWQAAAPEQRAAYSAGCRRMRLMVSGSAALPVQTLATWQQISGHVLLERYGMTELGMALSNPLHGERRPGSVGTPLPGVEVRVVDDSFRDVPHGTPGQLLVRGPNVFLEYLGRPEATAASFRDGWFLTGDVAVVEDGYFRLLGRDSVDIIKTGGFKVSALEIEEVLRTHPEIADCAVVGVPDAEWGERVGVAVVQRPGGNLTLDALRGWAKERLATYKVPSLMRVVEELPRNAMGKVVKPEVRALLESRAER